MPLSERRYEDSKKDKELVRRAGGLRGPEQDSALRVFKGWWHGWRGVHRWCVLWAVNGNWNDDGWNFNANPLDNPNSWNDGNQFLSRNSSLSPALYGAGVFDKSPLRQPPTILPMFSTPSPSVPYRVLVRSDSSHASCTKKRSESISSIAC